MFLLYKDAAESQPSWPHVAFNINIQFTNIEVYVYDFSKCDEENITVNCAQFPIVP